MNSTTHGTHPKTTAEGRGESITLQLLRQRYRSNHITVEQLLQDHLPHLGSLDALRRAINAGRVPLTLRRLGAGRKAPQIVNLTELADFIDQSTAAASQAA